jgi:hypothetical protein
LRGESKAIVLADPYTDKYGINQQDDYRIPLRTLAPDGLKLLSKTSLVLRLSLWLEALNVPASSIQESKQKLNHIEIFLTQLRHIGQERRDQLLDVLKVPEDGNQVEKIKKMLWPNESISVPVEPAPQQEV